MHPTWSWPLAGLPRSPHRARLLQATRLRARPAGSEWAAQLFHRKVQARPPVSPALCFRGPCRPSLSSRSPRRAASVPGPGGAAFVLCHQRRTEVGGGGGRGHCGQRAPGRGPSSLKSQEALLTETPAYSTGPTKSKPTAKKPTAGEGEGPEERLHSIRPSRGSLKMALGVADERDS